MVISFVALSKDQKKIVEKAKEIIDKIIATKYPKGYMEINFLIVSEDDSGERVYKGIPIVKVRYFNSYYSAVNAATIKLLGDYVFFVDTDSMELNDINAEMFLIDKLGNPGLIVGKYSILVKAGIYNIPEDLQCLKTYLIMHNLTGGKKVVGKISKLNKYEVLRFAHKFGSLSFKDKVKIIWGIICQ